MAFIYNNYFHILEENGDKTFIELDEWGRKKLSGAELDNFIAETDEAYAIVSNDAKMGKINAVEIEEDVTLQSGQTIRVATGRQLTFPNATEKYQFPAVFKKWEDRMKQDSSIRFIEPEWIDATP